MTIVVLTKLVLSILVGGKGKGNKEEKSLGNAAYFS